jgi:hypothetical protein
MVGAAYALEPGGSIPRGDVLSGSRARGSGDLVASTFLGGPGDNRVRVLKMNASRDVWVSGYTTSGDFPITDDALRPVHG